MKDLKVKNNFLSDKDLNKQKYQIIEPYNILSSSNISAR